MPMKMEQTEHSKMSAYKLQMPENYPEESIENVLYCYGSSAFSLLLYFICEVHILLFFTRDS